MDKIDVTQNARQAAFDAYLTCYESVPNDIWLQALLDGKHDGDEMVQAFARFEHDILATRTDATPVAWQTMDSAPKDGTPLMLFARSRYATAPVRVVGWYIEGLGWIECAFGSNRPVGLEPLAWQPLPDFPAAPDAPHPPATDVAALVEAAKAFASKQTVLESLADPTPPAWAGLSINNRLNALAAHKAKHDAEILAIRQALTPFTEGQNDD